MSVTWLVVMKEIIMPYVMGTQTRTHASLYTATWLSAAVLRYCARPCVFLVLYCLLCAVGLFLLLSVTGWYVVVVAVASAAAAVAAASAAVPRTSVPVPFVAASRS